MDTIHAEQDNSTKLFDYLNLVSDTEYGSRRVVVPLDDACYGFDWTDWDNIDKEINKSDWYRTSRSVFPSYIQVLYQKKGHAEYCTIVIDYPRKDSSIHPHNKTGKYIRDTIPRCISVYNNDCMFFEDFLVHR